MVFIKILFLLIVLMLIISFVVGGSWLLIKSIRNTRREWRLQNENDKRLARKEALRELTEGLSDFDTVADIKARELELR